MGSHEANPIDRPPLTLDLSNIDAYDRAKTEGPDDLYTQQELENYLESKIPGNRAAIADEIFSFLPEGVSPDGATLTQLEAAATAYAVETANMIEEHTRPGSRHPRPSSVGGKTDNYALPPGLTAHAIAFLLFLDSADLLDEIVLGTLDEVQKRNDEIKRLNDSKTYLNNVLQRTNGNREAEDKDKIPFDQREDVFHLARADALGATESRTYTNLEYYTYEKDGIEYEAVRTAGTSNVLYSTEPGASLAQFSTQNPSKKQVSNTITNIDQKIQELSSEVELIQTRVRNFLTKREGYVSGAGTVTQGLGGMLSGLR